MTPCFYLVVKMISKIVNLFIIHTKVVSMESFQCPLPKHVAPRFVGTNNHPIRNG